MIPDFGVPEPRSEDCLFLNVWSPGLDGARRPVMVWIHGGAFNVGSGSQPPYEAGKLAARGDVVVVTLNYRLGTFGFLYLKEVTGGRIPASGNEDFSIKLLLLSGSVIISLRLEAILII
jgi:para-nitrobenzyl esterase